MSSCLPAMCSHFLLLPENTDVSSLFTPAYWEPDLPRWDKWSSGCWFSPFSCLRVSPQPVHPNLVEIPPLHLHCSSLNAVQRFLSPLCKKSQGACVAGIHPAKSGLGEWKWAGKEGGRARGVGVCAGGGCWHSSQGHSSSSWYLWACSFHSEWWTILFLLAAAAIAHLYLPNNSTLLFPQLCFSTAEPLVMCAGL